MKLDINPAGGRRLLRLLAIGVPVLVVAGLAGAGVVSAQHRDAGSERIVAASGQDIDTLSTPTTASPTTLAPPSIPTTVPAPPTSVATTIARPTTSTTRPAPPTTAAPVPPTTAAAAGVAMVTLANNYSDAVQLKINGQTYQLAAGQQLGPVAVTPAPNGNDVIELRVSANLGCGEGDAQGYFVAGHRYLLTVAPGPDHCPPVVAPSFSVTPA